MNESTQRFYGGPKGPDVPLSKLEYLTLEIFRELTRAGTSGYDPVARSFSLAEDLLKRCKDKQGF